MDSMDELEKRAVRRGVVVGALGMLLVCLLAGWRLLPGYGNHLMTMLKLGQIVDTAEREFVGE